MIKGQWSCLNRHFIVQKLSKNMAGNSILKATLVSHSHELVSLAMKDRVTCRFGCLAQRFWLCAGLVASLIVTGLIDANVVEAEEG
jgi:hypothetical protein